MNELREQFEKKVLPKGCNGICYDGNCGYSGKTCPIRDDHYITHLETLLTTKYIKRSGIEGWIKKEQKRIKGLDLEDDLWKDGYAVALGNLQVEILKSKLEGEEK